MKALSVSSGTALVFFCMGVDCQHHAPTALPPRKTRYPFYRRLGRPQGRSGRVRKITPQQGFKPRTVQPVANRYTDYDETAVPEDKLMQNFIRTKKMYYIT